VLRAGKPADRDRAGEILGAWDEWHAENDRRIIAAGLYTASAESERLSDIAHGLRRELCAMPARTLPGLLAKAAIVARCFGEDETFADYCRDELGQSGETAGGEAVARSVAADLIAMLPAASNAWAGLYDPPISESAAGSVAPIAPAMAGLGRVYMARRLGAVSFQGGSRASGKEP
jgi:hypothetical protein